MTISLLQRAPIRWYDGSIAMEAAMFASLPAAATDFMDWPWSRIEPYYHDLRTIVI
jgi:hypothetical protein